MAPATQVNSATLIIGVTGSGKSSLARTLADYLWETYKKVLYYYACDGGGYPAKVQEGAALGIIKVFRMRTRDPGDLGLAHETCYRAAQGWWPRRINPATGEVEPGVEMVAPIVKRFEMRCPNGHLVKSVIAQGLLTPGACPTCKQMVTKQDMRVTQTLVASRGFENRGGCYYDGLSSMLSWQMMDIGQRAGKMELKGEEGAIGGKIVSGELKFGGTTRSHVGFTQTRGEELAHLSLGIPNLLVPPVFTALSMEASDEANLSIIGPKIAGRAKTDEAPQWFGNCLESAKIPAQQGTGEQFALYLSEFTDVEGRRHLLKHRGAPGTMPDVLLDPPGNADPFSQFNLGVFFRMLNDALQAGITQAQQLYPDAPGMSEGIEEFGDGGVTVKAEPQAAGPQTISPDAPAAPTPAATLKAPAPKPRAATKPKTATVPETPAAETPTPEVPAVEVPTPETGPPAPVAEPVEPRAPVVEDPLPPATPEPVSVPLAAAPASPAPTPSPTATPGNGSAVAARPAAAPPPGRRPTTAIPSRPSAGAPVAVAGAAGPGGPAPMKPPAAAPRPPTAVPRPKP